MIKDTLDIKLWRVDSIDTYVTGDFSDLLTKLGDTTEQGSRLLDQTAVLFGSNLGSANAHDPRNLPIMVAGGEYQHGRYVAHDRKDNTPLCNLFVTLLQRMGVETDQFATSNGALEII